MNDSADDGGLDAVDRSLLDRLQRDGRTTNSALADAVHVSASTCLRRVRRLEDAGFIDRYAAVLDRRAVGLGTTVFVEVTLTSQREECLEEFEAAVGEVPEVVTCHLMAGSSDYLLQVVATDVADFEDVHKRTLARLPHLAQIRSSIALRTVHETTVLPVRRPAQPPRSR